MGWMIRCMDFLRLAHRKLGVDLGGLDGLEELVAEHGLDAADVRAAMRRGEGSRSRQEVEGH